jgi:hypothetical protein
MNDTLPNLLRAVVIISAYQIRTAATLALYFVRCTAAAVWFVRPPVKKIIALCRNRYVPNNRIIPTVNGPYKVFNGRHEYSKKGSIRIKNPGDLFLLQESRIQELQSVFLKKTLSRYFGLHPADEDLMLLKQFSSAAWILKSLLKSAGYDTFRLDDEEGQFRIRIVYPVFVRVMSVQYRYMTGIEKGTPYSPEVSVLTFPDEISREKNRVRTGAFEEWYRMQVDLHRTEAETAFFKGYLDLVSLAAAGKAGKAGIQKFLQYMNQIKFQGGF